MQLADHVIHAKIITGTNVYSIILIPRMFVTPSDGKFPFHMKNKQFPVVVAFAITINKSQSQTLSKVGLFLPRSVFTLGQLYVALSRETSRIGLKILILDSNQKPKKTTLNVVYKEVFQNIFSFTVYLNI